MTDRAVLALIVIAAFRTLCFAQDMQPGPGAAASIVSSPTGAEVWRGDSLLGLTPIRVRSGGTDTLVLYYPARSAWRKSRAIAVPPFVPSTIGVVSVQLRAWQRVTSTPTGAAVFEGDSLLGHTPLDVEATPTAKLLLLRSPGWMDSTVVLEASDTLGMRVLLAKAPLAEHPQVLINPWSARLPSASIIVAGSVALAAGVTAVAIRQRADKNYDEYVRSGDRALLDRTRRGDIVSGVCLAIMEASAGYLVYLLLNGL